MTPPRLGLRAGIHPGNEREQDDPLFAYRLVLASNTEKNKTVSGRNI
jgi:hypothetical protein